MATAKSPVKKTTPKKKAVKKTPAKKAASKKSSAKAEQAYNSFKVSSNQTPFTNFRVTRQTVYWVVLIAFIIFAQLWILKLQIDVANLIDERTSSLSQ